MRTAAPVNAIVILGCVQGRKAGSGDGDFEKRMKESLHILDDRAEKYGVMLGFEIMNSYESDAFIRIEAGLRGRR